MHTLEAGTWSLNGNEVAVKVALSPAMIDLSMGPEVSKLVTAAVNEGRGTPDEVFTCRWTRSCDAGETGRKNQWGHVGAIAGDATSVGEYMQEKFGAEVRTVIDKKEER